MAGLIYRVSPKKTFDFSTVTPSGVQDVILAKAMSVAAVREGTLLVRVHTGTSITGGTIDVIVQSEAPSDDDPALDFVSTTGPGGSPWATVTLNSSTPVPT